MLGDKSRVDARYCMPLTLRKADLWEAKKMTFKNAEVMIFVEIMLASVNAGEKVIRFSRSRPEPVIQREPRLTGTR